MPWAPLAIGAGIGLLKSETIDKKKAERERALSAATERYSPWTGLHGDKVQDADPLGSMLTYGGAGAQMGQSIQNADAQKGLMDAQAKWYGGNTPSTPWSLGDSYSAYDSTSPDYNPTQGMPEYSMTPPKKSGYTLR